MLSNKEIKLDNLPAQVVNALEENKELYGDQEIDKVRYL